jgi:hypothetical protein
MLTVVQSAFFVIAAVMLQQSNGKSLLASKLIAPVGLLLLNLFKLKFEEDQYYYPSFNQMMYLSIFYCQGILDGAVLFQHGGRNRDRQNDIPNRESRSVSSIHRRAWRKMIAHTNLGIFSLVVFVTWVMSLPLSKQETGSLMFYPLYSNFLQSTLFTIGTCLWIYTLVPLTEMWLNESAQDPVQRLSNTYLVLVRQSYYVYLSHYTFLMLVLWLYPKKFMQASGYGIKIFFTFLFTLGLVLLSYILLKPILKRLKMTS